MKNLIFKVSHSYSPAYNEVGDKMLTNVVIALLFILTYFGLFCVIEWMDAKIRPKKMHNKEGVRLVLLVKNADQNIEEIVKTLKRSVIEDLTITDKLFIIDMKSSDLTFKILEKISQGEPSIEFVTFEQKDKIFELMKSK